jgi:aquaporin Z
VIVKKYLAEMIGTMVLVLIGCGSAVIAGGQIGFLGISFAFGFSVLAMAYGIGSISGCHINPAVTVGALVAGRISAKDAGMYVVFQVIGAIIGAGVLYYIASGLQGYNISTNGLGQNGFGEFSPMKYSMAAGFVAEVVLTFIFLIVILGATSSKAPAGFAGIPIGISLVIIHLVGIPITGTSVNPARSIGPALFVGGAAISQLWLFIVAPLIGAVIAGLVWKYVLEEKA